MKIKEMVGKLRKLIANRTHTVRPQEGSYVEIKLPDGIDILVKHESEGIVIDAYDNDVLTHSGYYFFQDLMDHEARGWSI